MALARANQAPIVPGKNRDETLYQNILTELRHIQQSGETIPLPADNRVNELNQYFSERAAQERKQALQSPPEIHPPEGRAQKIIDVDPVLLQEAAQLAKMEVPPNGVNIDQFVVQRTYEIYERLKRKQRR